MQAKTTDDSDPPAVIVLQCDGRDIVLGPLAIQDRCDIGLVERILRLQLSARRMGWSIRLVDVPLELRELVEFVGLAADLIGGGVADETTPEPTRPAQSSMNGGSPNSANSSG